MQKNTSPKQNNVSEIGGDWFPNNLIGINTKTLQKYDLQLPKAQREQGIISSGNIWSFYTIRQQRTINQH